MSTKSTIHFTKDFHLYKEIFDNDSIYLTIENFEDLSINIYSINPNGNLPRNITVKIKSEIFEQIIKAYNNKKV